MTNAIVKVKKILFKIFEKKIFEEVCEFAKEHTKVVLEIYDDILSKERDTSKYRNKGKRKTSIRTVYGDVEYERRVYQTRLRDGTKALVYLLDEQMGMEKIGLISTNLAEKIANSVTELPSRASAEMLSSSTGQTISAGGVWNIAQKLGQRITSEEDLDVKKMKAGIPDRKRKIGVLFEKTQNCTLITLRIKHRRMRWSESGADNLAKLLCRKENKDLIETVCCYSGELIFDESQSEIKEPLSTSKSPSRDGKGLPYMEVGRGNLPLTGTPLTAGRKALRNFILGN